MAATPATNNAVYSGTLSRGSVSPVIALNCGGWIRIANSAPITVRFGTVDGLTTSPATIYDVYYPAGSDTVQYDLGRPYNAVSIYAFDNNTFVSINKLPHC